MLRIFSHRKKSNGFGRDRTRELGNHHTTEAVKDAGSVSWYLCWQNCTGQLLQPMQKTFTLYEL
jgi:hypothetical protein